jgi:hypothetical protein
MMSNVDVRTIIGEASNRIGQVGSGNATAKSELNLPGAVEILAYIGEKVVIPIIVSLCGKILGDIWTKREDASVPELQAALAELPHQPIAFDDKGRSEAIAATTEKLRTYGYTAEQATPLAGDLVRIVEKAFEDAAQR